MALPTTIVSSATTTWSDHRNQSHGGAQRVTQYTDNSDNGTFYNLGDTHSHVALVDAFLGQAGHKLLRVRCYLQRVGNPTGNVFVEVREALGSTTIDLAAAPLGVSKSFPVSSVPTTGKNEIIFSFPVPVAMPASDSTESGIVLTISVQGDSSNYIKVYRGVNGDTGISHDYGAGSQVWSATGAGLSMSRVIEISKSGARVIALDKTNNTLKPYAADTNTGASWSAEPTGSITSTANLKSANAQSSINDIGTSYIAIPHSTANALGIYKRNDTTGPGLDPTTTVSFSTFGTNVTGVAPIFGGRRASGSAVLVAQGATETVMGSARRRIKLAFHNGTSWSSLFDVVGSTNTPNSTLPGDAVDYDLRWAALDPNGDFHIIYSKSDTSTLQYRKFKSDNTFATINTLNGAVASATANYPVGQGTFAYKSPDWYVVIPYSDNTSNTLKEARCKTADTTTSGNWVLTQIVGSNAETSGSNPALLMADNAQGGKVFCWRVKPTTKGLAATHDGGNSTWVAETDWRGATQVVGGISGGYTEDGIYLVYLEEGTSPDELRYDRL